MVQFGQRLLADSVQVGISPLERPNPRIGSGRTATLRFFQHTFFAGRESLDAATIKNQACPSGS